jgi:hypothetical protein
LASPTRRRRRAAFPAATARCTTRPEFYTLAPHAMGSLVDILCPDQPAPLARHTFVPEEEGDHGTKACDDMSSLGKPPFPLNGTRRKSGWGKRFKERQQGRLAIIFPRRKMGEAARGSDAVWLSVDVLNSLADRSLASAAKLLVSWPLPVTKTFLPSGVAWHLCVHHGRAGFWAVMFHLRRGFFLPHARQAQACGLTLSCVHLCLQGISATALKKACRELGVERWPYCRKRRGDAASTSGDDESRSDTATGTSSPVPSVSSIGAVSPADLSCKGEMPPPSDLMDLLHRNAVMVLEAAKKLESPEAGRA